MVINTNIPAQATAYHFKASQMRLAKSLARLSSGSRIIEPSDDAAGLDLLGCGQGRRGCIGITLDGLVLRSRFNGAIHSGL